MGTQVILMQPAHPSEDQLEEPARPGPVSPNTILPTILNVVTAKCSHGGDINMYASLCTRAHTHIRFLPSRLQKPKA